MACVDGSDPRFVDPWSSGFSGAGVRTYVDTAEGVCRPVAVLPQPNFSGDLRSLAEWFSVGAMSTARGMRLSVEPVAAVVESPEPTKSSLATIAPSVGYSCVDEGLQSGLREIARAVSARELPFERRDSEHGFCYLEMVTLAKRGAARAKLGGFPTLSEVATLPPEWLLCSEEIVNVGVVVRDGLLHFQTGGGDGKLSAYDLYQYARAGLSGATGADSALPAVLRDARVGGGVSVEPPVVPEVGAGAGAVVPSPLVVCGRERGADDGFCYLQLFRGEVSDVLRGLLGPFPSVQQVLVYKDCFIPDTALSLIAVVFAHGVMHLEKREALVVGEVSARAVLEMAIIENVTGLLAVRLGGAVPLGSVCFSRSPSCACVVACIRSEWGKLVLDPGETLSAILPRWVLDTLAPSRKGYALAGGCVVEVEWGEDLAVLLKREYYATGRVLCQPVRGVVSDKRCKVCGYGDSDGHKSRCRRAVVRTVEGRNAAWIGDAMHVLDVRLAVVRRGVQPGRATTLAQAYLSGEGQARYLQQVLCRCAGFSVRQASDYFEANYSELRTDYLVWLGVQLAGVRSVN